MMEELDEETLAEIDKGMASEERIDKGSFAKYVED